MWQWPSLSTNELYPMNIIYFFTFQHLFLSRLFDKAFLPSSQANTGELCCKIYTGNIIKMCSFALLLFFCFFHFCSFFYIYLPTYDLYKRLCYLLFILFCFLFQVLRASKWWSGFFTNILFSLEIFNTGRLARTTHQPLDTLFKILKHSVTENMHIRSH